MIEIRKTVLFAQWLDDLRDLQTRARVQARIERLAAGNPGDVEPRESLYKALSGDRSPGFDTILKVMGALGLKLHAEAGRG